MNIGKTGEEGETLAVRFLEKNGYAVLERNYQTRFGEVDIICRNERFLVFAEVKTRTDRPLVSGFDAVDRSKQRKILKAAMQYCQANPLELQPRFDVIAVIFGNRDAKIEHIENAFDSGGLYGFF